MFYPYIFLDFIIFSIFVDDKWGVRYSNI